MKNYYNKLSYAISRLENGLYPTMTIERISDKIEWCWKFRHITERQLEELCDRMVSVNKMLSDTHTF